MSIRPALAVSAAWLLLSGCAVHVHGEDTDAGSVESCSVRCESGTHARVTCEKPRVPACRCEPGPAAACISARRPGSLSIL